MTQPVVYLWRMLGFLAFVAVVTFAVWAQLRTAFAANPVLNSVILAVLIFGIGWNLRQVLVLRTEVTWLEGFRSVRGADQQVQPRLLAPMASLLGDNAGRDMISTQTLRSVLDSIGAWLDESRDTLRYRIEKFQLRPPEGDAA